MKPGSVMAALASTDTQASKAGGFGMASTSPNMRAKKDTKISFGQLHSQVLVEMEVGMSPRAVTTDQLLQALIAVGGMHLDEVVVAVKASRR